MTMVELNDIIGFFVTKLWVLWVTVSLIILLVRTSLILDKLSDK